MAYHHYAVAVDRLVIKHANSLILGERPTQNRLDVPLRKEIWRDHSSADSFDEILAFAFQIQAFHPNDLGKEFLFRSQNIQRMGRHAAKPELIFISVALFADLNQPIRLVPGDRIEQHRIDDAVNRGAGSNAERQRQDSHGTDSGVLQQLADGEAEVLHSDK